MKLRLCILLFVCMICHSLLASDEVIERVRREAPVAWKEYLLRLDVLEKDEKEIVTENGKLQKEESSQHVFLYPNKLAITTAKDGTSISGTNALYSFSLFRESQKDEWVIRKLEKLPPCVPHDEIQFPALKSLPRYVTPGESTNQWNAASAAIALKTHYRTWLPSYFESPDFKITDAVSTIDGEESVKVTFEYEPTDYAPNELMRSGEVVLLPKKYWVIKTITYTALEPDQKTRVKSTFNFDYIDLPDGLPVPSQIEHLTNADGSVDPNSFNRTIKYKWNRPKDPIDQKIFTLSNYGLPEPSFVIPKGNRVRYILMIISLVMVIGGVIAKIRNRKKS